MEWVISLIACHRNGSLRLKSASLWDPSGGHVGQPHNTRSYFYDIQGNVIGRSHFSLRQGLLERRGGWNWDPQGANVKQVCI